MRRYTLYNNRLFQLPTKLLLLFVWLFSALSTIAASNHSNENLLIDIELKVIDGSTGEELIGVNVFADNISHFAGTTDHMGKIKLKLDQLGHREVVNFTYVGYTDLKVPVYEIRNRKGLIKMYLNSEDLAEVVVIGRHDNTEEEIPYTVTKINKESIAFNNPQTAADALEGSGEVYVQKSQMGGGSPVLRGFEANRVLLVLDGVRMNNAIYRSGHLQNAITVDNSMLEQIEVINGPGSLSYGSDALGGVVHFRTKDPKILFGDGNGNDHRIEMNAFGRFSTANKEKTTHIDIDYGNRRWGSLTSLSFSDFGDLRAGSKRPAGYEDWGKRPFYQLSLEQDMILDNVYPDVQVGTGYSQLDVLQKLKFQPNDSLYFVANFQFSTSSNVPRYDNLTDTLGSADRLKYIEWYYGPQRRLMGSVKMRMLKPHAFYDKGTVIGAFQRIDEDRLNREFKETHREYNFEDVYVYSFTADFDKYLDKKQRHTIAYGLDANYNQVSSTAGRINIHTGAIIEDVYTRYPSGGSTVTTYAGYANYRWKSRDSSLVFNAGARYSMIDILAKYAQDDIINWPASYFDGVQLNNDALNWGAGLTWNSKSKWQVRLLASTSFRSPNIDDFGKMRVKGGKILVPNPDLKAEDAINGEITLAKEFGRINREGIGTTLKISTTGFYTELSNAIVRADSTMNGEPLYGEFEVQKNVNASSAIVQGISGNLLLKVNDKWRFLTSINYTKGQSYVTADSLVALAHIPPVYGRAALSYKTKRFKIQGVVKFNGAKPIEDYDPGKKGDYEGTSDNAEYGLIGEDGSFHGTPAWTTYNLYSTFYFNEKLSLQIDVENMTDIHYRPFASGVSAPGRNFIIALRKTF